MNDLSHLAFRSSDTFGRALIPELDRDFESYWMDPFILDFIIKLINSKAYRPARKNASNFRSKEYAYSRQVKPFNGGVSIGYSDWDAFKA